MKNIIWIIIGLSILSAVLIPAFLKEKVNSNNIVNDKETSSRSFQKPENITINNDSVIVKIIDIEGAEINLISFNSICNENYESMNYKGNMLSNIFQKQKVIPIQAENGPCKMYFIDKIDEYFFDGKNAHILLHNGITITGVPVKDYEISGKSTYGDITITMDNLQYAKFNEKIPTEITQKSKDELKSYLGFSGDDYFYWPDSYEKYSFSIITKASLQIELNAAVFIYDMHGCDDNWIPCKPYNVWKLSNYFIPVKNGTFIMKIPVDKIKSATFDVKEIEYDKEYHLDIVLLSGEHLSDVLLYNGKDGYEREYCVSVGILGLIENGFAFLSVNRIKQIKMKSPPYGASLTDGL